MARRVQDREDLLREATALEPRMALRTTHPTIVGEIFFGFRGRALSVYFGSDPVFHFNPAGQLRRAFYAGHILKAEKGELVRWTTQRSAVETTQLCAVLSAQECAAVREDLLGRTEALGRALATQDYELVGEVPTDGSPIACWNAWLKTWPGFVIAATPRVGEIRA